MIEPIDFQPYLESIRAAYAKWWQLYTLTDAAGRQRQEKQVAPTFDFGLMVQRVKQEERREEEKIERFPVLEGIRKYAVQHVLLVGRPGSGKSTALARLMLEEATTPQGRIPILVELRYWQGSIEQLIRDSLSRHGLRAKLEIVLERSLILFDGVNELPSEEARSQLSAFRRNHPKLPMIFTTRDLSLGGDLGIEQKLEMQPLTEAQIQAFIRAYVPEQAEQMLRQLKDRLRELGQTPLLLWMLCEVFEQSPDQELPKNLGGIFQVFTRMYEDSSKRKHEVASLKGDVRPLSDRRLWKKALKVLAWLMMQGSPVDFRRIVDRTEAEEELSRTFPNERLPIRDILDDLLKYHLLQNQSIDQIEFRHQLIQEYYAAEALLEQLPKLEDKQLKQEFLNFLKWTEPLALMLAFVDEVQAVRIVKLALKVDRKLGARLAGEVKGELQEKTVRLVDALETPNWLKVELLRETRSDSATHGLLKLMGSSDSHVRWNAVEVLGDIRSIPAFLLLLEDPDPRVRGNVADALGAIDSELAIDGLLKLLEDPDPGVRLKALEALITNSDIDCEIAIDNLLKLVEDPDPSVRWNIAEVLGDIGSEPAIDGLLKLLEDSDSDVRGIAAEALCDIGSEVAIDGLLKLLKHSDSDVRRNVVVVVENIDRIDRKVVIDGLFKFLKDSDPSVCKSAKEGLNEIISELDEILRETDVPSLLKLPEKSNSGVLPDTSTVKKSDSGERRRSAEMLVNSSPDIAIPALLKLLEDAHVRRSAASALRNIAKQHTDTIAPHLPHLLTLIPTALGQYAYRIILAI
jgi:HEAT repeat protein